ncbi:MAG: hypothetical protein ABII19_03900 [Patescibacteria group bacterium]
MNYNDIESRLKIIYTSIDQQYSYGVDALNETCTKIDNEADRWKLTISFYDPSEEPKVLNQINSVISNLANIKDCLKQKLKERGDDPKVIESEIDNSTDLQLILDLANQEKHGYPLTKTRRSQKDPLIKNISRSLTPSNKPDNIRVEKSDGSAILNAMTSITAEITDYTGNLLCHLDDLVENALNIWEQIIKKYNIT